MKPSLYKYPSPPPHLARIGRAGMSAVATLLRTSHRSGIETAIAELEDDLQAYGASGALRENADAIFDWLSKTLRDERERDELARQLHVEFSAFARPRDLAQQDVLDRIRRLPPQLPLWAPFQACLSTSSRHGARPPLLEFNVALAVPWVELRRARMLRDPERRARSAIDAVLKVYERPYKYLLEFLVALNQMEAMRLKNVGTTLGALEAALADSWPSWLETGVRERRNGVAHVQYTPLPRELAIRLHAHGKSPEMVITTDELLDHAEQLLGICAGVFYIVLSDTVVRAFFNEEVLKLALEAVAERRMDVAQRAMRLVGTNLRAPARVLEEAGDANG